jgi:hypothetical protein
VLHPYGEPQLCLRGVGPARASAPRTPPAGAPPARHQRLHLPTVAYLRAPSPTMVPGTSRGTSRDTRPPTLSSALSRSCRPPRPRPRDSPAADSSPLLAHAATPTQHAPQHACTPAHLRPRSTDRSTSSCPWAMIRSLIRDLDRRRSRAACGLVGVIYAHAVAGAVPTAERAHRLREGGAAEMVKECVVGLVSPRNSRSRRGTHSSAMLCFSSYSLAYYRSLPVFYHVHALSSLTRESTKCYLLCVLDPPRSAFWGLAGCVFSISVRCTKALVRPSFHSSHLSIC